MSRLFLTLLLFGVAALAHGAPTSGSSGVRPAAVSAVDEALQRARLQARPVVIYFQMQGCSWCRRFESEVLSQEAVKQKLLPFELIKVDIFEEKSLAQQYAIRGAPAFVLINASGEPVARSTGFLDREKFLHFLEAAATSSAAASPAYTGVPSDPDVMETPPVIARLRAGSFADLSEEELAQFVLLNAHAETKFLGEEILQAQELPPQPVVSLLGHRLLAVRLGALQLLEDRSGEAFGFDPWADDPAANKEAIVRWEAWAAGTQQPGAPTSDPEALLGYINDLLSDDVVRSQRGFRALLRVGEPAVATVVDFERLNPALNPVQKGRVRELRYAILLSGLGVQDAEPLAHRLVFGNLDVRIQAMNTVAALGPGTLPLFDEYLVGREPLERETAVECIVRAGQAAALPRIASLLERETDANVLHAALRRLGETGGSASLIQPFVKNENEDLSIAALEGLAKLKAAETAPSVLPALKDERWRVRVAALKTTADLKLTGAESDIIDLLSDPDEFVRISAVEAATEMKLPGALAVMEKLFIAQDELKPAIVQSYSRMSARIPPAFISALEKTPDDVVLAVIGSVPDADVQTHDLLQWAARHKNEDIACAALRLVASKGLDRQENLDVVSEAILSGDPRKIQAILQSVVLDRSRVRQVLPSANTVTFNGPVVEGKSLSDRNSDRFRSYHSEPALDFKALAAAIRKAPATGEDDDINAQIILTQLGDEAAAVNLSERVASLTVSQRARLANALSVQRTFKTRSLFERLLDDPEAEVRNEAISSLLEEGADASCAAILFGVLRTPGSYLRPQEALHYRLKSRYSVNQGDTAAYRALYLKTLQDTTDPSVQVVVLDLLGAVWDASCADAVKPFLTSDSPWVRRAAFFALGKNEPGELKKYHDQILADSSPYVRAALPAAYIRESFYWNTHFSASESDMNSEDGSSNPPITLAPEDVTTITRLMSDPDPAVQMMAGMCLFSHLQPLDAGRLFALVKQDRYGRYYSYSFRNVFQQHLDRMPDEYALLAPLVEFHEDDPLKARIEKRFPPPQTAAAPEATPAPAPVVETAVAPTPPPSPVVAAAAPASSGIQLVYFSKPGCSHCSRVKAMLARVAESFPELEVTEYNINKNDSMELNETLSRRFGVPENLRLVAPSVFTSAGFLVNDDIVEERVGDIIHRAREQGNLPLEIEAADPAVAPVAAQAIAERYARINVFIILTAGILDGLNPCAFATIIFLLSYLQVARKTPREMAQIGVAYVAGVFSSYFLLGLGLSEIVAHIVVFRQAALVLNVGMGLFACVIAILSFRDGIRCLQGRLQDISLQLPAVFKDRIRSVIRKSVPQRGFVLAAFGVGAFISLLELACTGQVYAPTILYMIQAGKGGAVGYLLLYNLAFILPLSAVFIMAFFGLTSGRLTAFLQRHAAIVKFGMSLLFFLLAFVLFAREWAG